MNAESFTSATICRFTFPSLSISSSEKSASPLIAAITFPITVVDLSTAKRPFADFSDPRRSANFSPSIPMSMKALVLPAKRSPLIPPLYCFNPEAFAGFPPSVVFNSLSITIRPPSAMIHEDSNITESASTLPEHCKANIPRSKAGRHESLATIFAFPPCFSKLSNNGLRSMPLLLLNMALTVRRMKDCSPATTGPSISNASSFHANCQLDFQSAQCKSELRSTAEKSCDFCISRAKSSSSFTATTTP